MAEHDSGESSEFSLLFPLISVPKDLILVVWWQIKKVVEFM